MAAEDLNWEGYEVPAAEATWVCVKSAAKAVPQTPDQIDYVMEFEARDPRVEGIPASRKLQLRTSGFRVVHDADFVAFLGLVVQGQLLEPGQWDQFKEVYEKD